jgi:hypothetical protein
MIQQNQVVGRERLERRFWFAKILIGQNLLCDLSTVHSQVPFTFQLTIAPGLTVRDCGPFVAASLPKFYRSSSFHRVPRLSATPLLAPAVVSGNRAGALDPDCLSRRRIGI